MIYHGKDFEEPNKTNYLFTPFSSANLPKTQIEDLPATDNKLESIVDVPGASVEDEEQETDEGESDDLIHDDDGEGVDADQGEHSEESGPGEADKGIKGSASGTVIYTENASQAPNPTPGIILTGDGIIERLMAAEVGITPIFY